MPNKQNLATVEELKTKMGKANIMLVSEYRALSVAEFGELRAALRKSDAELIVSKNTLTKIAANDLGITGLDEFLGGPITLLLGYGDPVATAKALNTYVKAAKKTVTLRGGLLGLDRIGGEDLERVASTPSREQSISKVMASINSPATGIAAALNGVARNIASILLQVSEGKGNNAAA